MMKFIDLTDVRLGSLGTFSQLDVLTLEVYMLYPDDELARQRARTTTGLEFVKRHRDLLPDDFLADLFSTAFDADSLQTLQEQSRNPYAGGIIAGSILHHALGTTLESATGNSVSYAVTELTRRLRTGYSKPTIYALWRKFKKVSHYWAAYVSERMSKKGSAAFPCRADSLPHFLAVAEAFRELGQTSRAWKSPKTTILDAGQSLQLPYALELPLLVRRPPIFYFSKSL